MEGDCRIGDLTRRLRRWGSGDGNALSEVVALTYPELRRIAGSYFRRERLDHTLQATAVVNELYLRLAKLRPAALSHRRDFYAFAAHLMRIILVDYKRQTYSEKRAGGHVHVPLHEEMTWVNACGEDILALDLALEELQALDERKARVIELRYFLGCTNAEAADILGISKPTVDRDLEFAKCWLFAKLGAVCH